MLNTENGNQFRVAVLYIYFAVVSISCGSLLLYAHQNFKMCSIMPECGPGIAVGVQYVLLFAGTKEFKVKFRLCRSARMPDFVSYTVSVRFTRRARVCFRDRKLRWHMKMMS